MTHEPHEPSSEETSAEMGGWAELSASWRGQELATNEAVSTEQIARRAKSFARTIRWRNARELVVAVGLVALGVHEVLHARDWLGRLPGIAMIAGVSWVAVQLMARGRNPRPPRPTATTTEVLAHERAQMERQIALLRGVRRWYLGPLLVPVVVTIGASVMTVHARGAEMWTAHRILILLGVISFIGAVFVLVDRLNARAAAVLARRLESLGE